VESTVPVTHLCFLSRGRISHVRIIASTLNAYMKPDAKSSAVVTVNPFKLLQCGFVHDCC